MKKLAMNLGVVALVPASIVLAACVPAHACSVVTTINTHWPNARALAVRGQTLLVGVDNGDGSTPLCDGSVLAYDVSDPRHIEDDPNLTPSLTDPLYDGVNEIKLVGGLAYLSNDNKGLTIADVDPTSPEYLSVVGRYEDPDYSGPYTCAYTGIDIHGTLAYAADHWNGLKILDVSDPTNPQRYSGNPTFALPRFEQDVEVAGGVAFIPNSHHPHDALLSSVDVTDPQNPVLKDHVHWTPFYSGRLALYGNHAYVAAGEAGLRVIDITYPTNMVEVGDYPKDARDVVVVDDIAYVPGSDGVLRLLDVSDPSDPLLVESCALPAGGQYVAVDGQWIYVSLVDGTVAVIPEPATLSLLGLGGLGVLIRRKRK